MRYFLHYWFVAVPKLTIAQAFALFYRFVRYVSWSYDVEWGDQPLDDDDYGDYCPAKYREGHCSDPTCTTGVINLSERDGKRFAEALANPPEPNEALKEAARKYKEQQGDDVV
jgi:hypothetical protein